MSEQKSGNVGKIVLIIVLVLCGLGAACGGVMWYFASPGIEIAKSSVSFQQALTAEFGPGVTFQPISTQPQSVILAVGLPGSEELTEEGAREAQDKIWTLYAQSFASGGMPFARSLAVGSASGGGLSGWEQHEISIDDLVARTGVAAPPASRYEALVPDNAKVTVTTREKTDSPPTDMPDEAPTEDE
jgi:hypothetical protein